MANPAYPVATPMPLKPVHISPFGRAPLRAPSGAVFGAEPEPSQRALTPAAVAPPIESPPVALLPYRPASDSAVRPSGRFSRVDSYRSLACCPSARRPESCRSVPLFARRTSAGQGDAGRSWGSISVVLPWRHGAMPCHEHRATDHRVLLLRRDCRTTCPSMPPSRGNVDGSAWRIDVELLTDRWPARHGAASRHGSFEMDSTRRA
jgi:hypothetical protein